MRALHIRRPWSLQLWLWLTLGFALGCSEVKTRDATTQVTLRVQVADAELAARLTRVDVKLAREEGGWVPSSVASLAVSGRFPIDFPILPRSAASQLKRFEVVVDGIAGSERVTQSRVISSFVPGSLRLLEVFLYPCQGGSCAEDSCHGEGCASCGAVACQPVNVIPGSDLLPFTPDVSPVVGDDASMEDAQLVDANVLPEAALEAGSDASVADSTSPAGGGDAAEAGSSGCAQEGAMRCVGEASQQREQCSAGQWQAAAACPEAQVCVSEGASAGACVATLEACRGSAGAAVCAGAVLHVCGANGSSSKAEECGSARLCEAGVPGKACAACLAGEHRCVGTRLERCDAQLKWQLAQECPSSGAMCNAEAGACTNTLCRAGTVGCNADTSELRRCNAAENGYELVTACMPGLCDALGGQCDVCTPGAKSCDSNRSRVCNADGQAYTTTACVAPRAICAGAGNCVACVNDTQCSAAACRIASCNVASGTCSSTLAPRGSACTGGKCDGAGTCGYCGDGIQQSNEVCDDGNSSNTDNCTTECARPRCGDGFEQTGEECDDGNTSNTDACTNACQDPRCGDGHVQSGEVCDDGNNNDTDDCARCRKARCGDGFLQRDVEECENNVGGWTAVNCNTSTCKRKAYLPCSGNGDCPLGEICHSTVFVCGPQTCLNLETGTVDLSVCKTVPGFTRNCYLDVCLLQCNSSNACPVGLRCQQDPSFPLFNNACLK